MSLKIKKERIFIYGVFIVLLVLAFTNPSERKLMDQVQKEQGIAGEKVIERTKNGVIFSVYKVYFNSPVSADRTSKEYLGIFNHFYTLSKKAN